MSAARDEGPMRAEQGLRVEAAQVAPEQWREALSVMTDYRGDATLERREGEPLVGYVFDCTDTALRVLPQDGGPATSVPIAEVAAIELSGRDTAAGKSFETWIRKWAESRAGS